MSVHGTIEGHDGSARDRLEGALVHLTDVIVLQGERMDFGFASLRDEMHAMRDEMRSFGARLDTVGERLDTMSDRLDRFVGVTTKERTSGIERLALIEERLAKLEERVGI
jgi:hypothetical protein